MVGTGIFSNNMRSSSPECCSTRHSGWWPYTVTPSIDKEIQQFLTLLLIWTLLPNLSFYLIARGYRRTFATDEACQQRTLTPPDSWFCPTLTNVLMLIPISWTCLVSGLLSFEHPSVLLFSLWSFFLYSLPRESSFLLACLQMYQFATSISYLP